MSIFKVESTSVLYLIVIEVLLFALKNVNATPAAVSIHLPKQSPGTLEQQDLYSVLTSIEEHLRNLDKAQFYEPNIILEDKINKLHAKLENVEAKLSKLDIVVTLSIENLAENNNRKINIIKEEIRNKVDENRKLILEFGETINQKLANHSAKSQDLNENIMDKLEKMEDEMTRRDEDTKTELADIGAMIEDLKAPYYISVDEADNTNRQLNQSSRLIYQHLSSNVNSETNKLCKNMVGDFKDMKLRMEDQFKIVNWTSDIIQSMKTEIQGDLNEYANKVADMSSELWEAHEIIDETIHSLERAINFTRTDLQNTLKKFMLQFSKRLQKRNGTGDSNMGDSALEEINNNLNTNFEKMLSTQNLFLESCYRLQKDDSQIEKKIEGLLQSFGHTLEEKSIKEVQQIESILAAMRKHDTTFKEYVAQYNQNIRLLNGKNNEARTKAPSCSELTHVANKDIEPIDEMLIDKNHLNDKDVLLHSKILEKTTVLARMKSSFDKNFLEETEEYTKDLYKIFHTIKTNNKNANNYQEDNRLGSLGGIKNASKNNNKEVTKNREDKSLLLQEIIHSLLQEKSNSDLPKNKHRNKTAQETFENRGNNELEETEEYTKDLYKIFHTIETDNKNANNYQEGNRLGNRGDIKNVSKTNNKEITKNREDKPLLLQEIIHHLLEEKNSSDLPKNKHTNKTAQETFDNSGNNELEEKSGLQPATPKTDVGAINGVTNN